MTTVRTTVTTAGLGRIELSRPEALNALDTEMIATLRQVLEGWREDAAVRGVLVTGEGRAFCAGGDVRRVRELVTSGTLEEAVGFFAAEYGLNRLIAEYPKPYLAVIDGICMGGGLGISVHGTARVVTDRAVLAMPETAIGFMPDVGTSHVFARLRGDGSGAVGRYLLLTGARIGAADALDLGLASHRVAETGALVAALEERGPRALEEAVAASPAGGSAEGPGRLPRELVEEAFSAGSVPETLARLDRMAAGPGAAADWAGGTAAILRSACPTSLVAAHELLAAAPGVDLRTCLEQELRAARHLVARPDFAEGVRAALVDKDRSPAWSPEALEEVDPDELRRVIAGAA